MDEVSGSTCLRLGGDLYRWLSEQARGRDSSRSALIRALIRDAMALVALTEEGGPKSWPRWVDPPQRERKSGRKRDKRTGIFA